MSQIYINITRKNLLDESEKVDGFFGSYQAAARFLARENDRDDELLEIESLMEGEATGN